MQNHYDIIGDIHGYANDLVQLLQLLSYEWSKGYYSHPERKVIFVGDFIDRGPNIKETLEIVRPMIDNGAALAVMGNHEYNAICYHTPKPDGHGFLRSHNETHDRQHRETVKQLSPGELQSYVTWFKTLPLWLDLGQLRVIHACWDDDQMNFLSTHLNNTRLTDEVLFKSAERPPAADPQNPFYIAVEELLEGKEINLPAGMVLKDKEGHERREMRIKWFQSPSGHTFASYCLPASAYVPDVLISDDLLCAKVNPYPENAPPVFFGHYWLPPADPEPLGPNVACVDYSVAKGGFLCAYRFDGEAELTNARFVRAGR